MNVGGMRDDPTRISRTAYCHVVDGRPKLYDAAHGPDTEILFRHATPDTVEQQRWLEDLLAAMAGSPAIDFVEVTFHGENVFERFARDPSRYAVTFTWDGTLSYDIRARRDYACRGPKRKE